MLNVVELYNFIIIGQPESNIPTQFNNIIQNNNICGIIETQNVNRDQEQYLDYLNRETDSIGSCDSINSINTQTGGTYNINNFDLIYTEHLNKRDFNDIKELDDISKIDVLNNLKEVINIRKNDLHNYINIYDTDLHNECLILNLNFNINDKVIIFGDLHGSFHTFYRHIKRLESFGILNNFKLKENYNIIFLGDIIDRGSYGVELIYYINKLIINNKNNVILNRGNHEDVEVYSEYGFIDECSYKLSSQIEEYKKLFYIYVSLLTSAITINKKIWLSHGGTPVSNECVKIDMTKRYFKLDNQDMHNFNYQIKWNDYNPGIETYNSSRGDELYQIGLNDLNNFLECNKLEWVIRAHQDHYSNAFILNYKYNTLNFIDGNYNKDLSIKYIVEKNDVNNLIYFNKDVNNKIQKNGMTNYIKQVDGATCRLILSKKEAIDNNYMPVLTISTNTDLNRKLTRDSLIILRFDLLDI